MNSFNPRTYFEDIGAWPKESGSLLRMYVIGFVLSLVVSGAAFYTAVELRLPQAELVAFLCALALVQLVVQLLCFLHLGSEKEGRGKLLALGFAVLITAIVVTGSLWIMNNLNVRMTSTDMQQYMQSEGGF